MKTKIFIIVAILLAQVVGLFWVSSERERERAENPKFLLECGSYDPRDLLRGHYLPINFKIATEDIPFSKLDAETQKVLREKYTPEIEERLKRGDGYDYFYFETFYDDFWIVLNPNPKTGFWETDCLTPTDPKIDFNANPGSGKIALPIRYILARVESVSPKPPVALTVEDFFTGAREIGFSINLEQQGIRYYVPEEKAKEFDREYAGNNEHVVAAEVFLRDDGTLGINRLLIDGKEF